MVPKANKLETTQTYHNYVDRTALLAALNDPTNPYKVTGGNSAAANAAISPTFSGKQSDELDFVEARAQRELMQLGGGALGFSVGGSFMHKKLDAPDAEMFATGSNSRHHGIRDWPTKTSAPATWNAAPVPVEDASEIDGAARIDHYDTYGNSQSRPGKSASNLRR